MEGKAIGEIHSLPIRPFQASHPTLRMLLRGTPGDESQDYGYNFTNARRRSNSSSHSHHHITDFKTKFEAVEADPVFEEEVHGAKIDVEDEGEMSHLEKGESADSISTASVDDEELAKK